MIKQAISVRAAKADNLLQVANEEIIPVLRAARDIINGMVSPVVRAEAEVAAAVTVDWTVKRHALIALSAPLVEVVFDDPVDAGYYYLEILQVGGGNTIGAWPANVRWEGAAAPVVTATAGRYDLGEFYWDGALYLARMTQDYG